MGVLNEISSLHGPSGLRDRRFERAGCKGATDSALASGTQHHLEVLGVGLLRAR
jgi:hypothetical protein